MTPIESGTPHPSKVICINEGRLRFAEKQREITPPKREEWSGWQAMSIAIARQRCSSCYGLGMRDGKGGAQVVCHCVFRTIFSVCMNRYRSISQGDVPIGRVNLAQSMSRGRNSGSHSVWSLKNEEFLADFQLIAFRALNGGMTREQLAESGATVSPSWKLFVLHMLMGGQCRQCCLRLNMDRGNFFHAVYRIQVILGAAFSQTEPHALFPLDEYFSPTTRKRPLSALQQAAAVISGKRKAA